MVETKVDVLRPTPLSLSQKEIDEIEEQIAGGQLPSDYLDRCDDAREANVFGHDHKKDKRGNPIEQGIGSAANQTANSLAAYRKYCNPENPKAADPDPHYADNLKRMQAELEACNAERKLANDGRRKRGRR